jgi:hypothetical protein
VKQLGSFPCFQMYFWGAAMPFGVRSRMFSPALATLPVDVHHYAH